MLIWRSRVSEIPPVIVSNCCDLKKGHWDSYKIPPHSLVMGSRKRVWTVLRKGWKSVEMGSEICNKIKPWIFHSKIIPPDCVLQCLPALAPSACPASALAGSIHQCSSSAQNLHHSRGPDGTNPSGTAPAQPQNLPGWISYLCLFNFHFFFVIVQHADIIVLSFSLSSPEQ